MTPSPFGLKNLSHVTVIVRDCDEALQWYVEKLGFEKRMDHFTPDGFRYLSLGVPGQVLPEIILQQPSAAHHGEEGYRKKLAQIGNGTTWIFEVESALQALRYMKAQQIKVTREPTQDAPGAVVLIEDLYGNTYVFRQASAQV